MIPGEIFTGFPEFQGIVCVNDFRLPIWLQEVLQASLCFLRSFCFALICLDPLGGQVLHHDGISMIVSRFTTFTENFVICCYQVTNILSAKQSVSPFYRGLLFMCFCGFWLAWGCSTTGFTVLSSTFELDTSTAGESISLCSSLSRVSLSLDIAVVGEEDELEENVE